MGKGAEKEVKQATNEKEFQWSPTDEPHVSRRKLILSDPERKKKIQALYGHCPLTKWKVLAMVSLQLTIAYLLQKSEWKYITIVAWTIGGAMNHSLSLAVHELSHNLGAGGKNMKVRTMKNRALAIFANFAQGVPSAATFKRYHLEHHTYQGIDGIDSDIPTDFERKMFRGPILKAIWVFCQPLAYGLRPLFVRPKPMQLGEFINLFAVVLVDMAIIHSLGIRAFGYLALSTFLGMGWHPVAGHFIAEHYTFIRGQETYSYYGPLNWLSFNVGYHNEHHDFPMIPGSRLPQVRAIAPEFYNTLPYHTSWMKVIWDFTFLSDIGTHSRTKRKQNVLKAPIKAE